MPFCPKKPLRLTALAGFTLVELSIVLVIVGLLFGAVLVGRDLIHEAEIRATLRQIDSYKTAVNTFRLKFNALPGDMLPTDAAQAGLYVMNGGGGGLDGDNDGRLGSTGFVCDSEPFVFWRHLSDANLVPGRFGPSFRANDQPNYGAPVADYLPRAKLGDHVYISARFTTLFTSNVLSGANTYTLFTPSQPNFNPVAGSPTPTQVCGVLSTAPLTPSESYAMDKKADDGVPNLGTVSAGYGSVNVPTWAAAAADGNCLFGGGGSTDTLAAYNVSPATGGNTRSCSLRFNF